MGGSCGAGHVAKELIEISTQVQLHALGMQHVFKEREPQYIHTKIYPHKNGHIATYVLAISGLL